MTDVMLHPRVLELMASRVCHDLVSPVGAVNNGVELMEVNLRDPAAVRKLKELITRHDFPVTGTSYGAEMWKRELQSKILDDVRLVVFSINFEPFRFPLFFTKIYFRAGQLLVQRLLVSRCKSRIP